MTSETDILNNALILIGEQTVLTADDTTKQGRRFIQVYGFLRDALLRAHYWNFALKRASIAALTSTPAWGYQYEYQLPDDCLTLIQVGSYSTNINAGYYNQVDNSPYKIESGKILTDLIAPLNIRYIRKVDNSSEFDPSFSEMIAIKIAIHLNEDLTNNTAMIDRLSQLYKESKQRALRGNAIEKSSQGFVDGDDTLARV